MQPGALAFTLYSNGDRLRASAGKAQRKPLELLWLLVAADDRGLAEDFVADELWPDLDGDRAMHTLRTTLYRLRKLIGPEAVDRRMSISALTAPPRARTWPFCARPWRACATRGGLKTRVCRR
jgi:hypothetical protein